MTLKVELQQYEDLSAEEKECVPNNGAGKEYATYLRVTHNGATLFLESDAVEPEDATLHRDYGWVAGAIQQAYELGRADAS